MTVTANRKAVFYLIAAILLYGVVAGFRATTGICSTVISDATGLSYGTVSNIFAIRNLIFAFSCLLFGLLTRKIPVRYLMLSGLVLVAIGFVGTAFSMEYVPLLIFLGIFIGLGAGALCFALVFAAAAPFFGEKKAGICAGVITASQGIFNIFITPVIEACGSTAIGLTFCFVGLGTVTACLIPLCFLFKEKKTVDTKEDSPKEYRSFIDPLKYMVKRPIFYIIALAFLTYGISDGGMLNHLYEKVTEVFNADSDIATLLVMIYGFGLIIGPIIGGIVASKTKNFRFVLAIIFSTWIIVSIVPSLFSVSLVSAIIVVLGMGITVSSVYPLFSLLIMEESPSSLYISIFPILSTFEFLGASFDSFYGGLCFDIFNNFRASVLLTYLLCIIVIVLFIVSGLKYRKKLKSGEKKPL